MGTHLELATRLRSNHGLITAGELTALGYTRSKIRTRVSRGHLERLGPGVYGLHGYPPSFQRRVKLAVLRLGDCAVASHRTAAYLLGFDTFRAGRIEVVVPGSGHRHMGNVVVHRTGRLDDCDITEVDGIACTSAARTIIDLSAVCDERSLLHAIGSAERDGHMSFAYLHARLAELRGPGRRGVVNLDRTLSILPGGGLHSALEVAFMEISRTVIDLVPETQVKVRADGTTYRLDVAYPPSPVVAEVDGHGTHSTGPQRTRDARRTRDLQTIGRQVVPFTSFEVFHEPRTVARDLRRALEPYFPHLLLRA